MCDSKELLVSFLYDELDSVERQDFQVHLASCVDCRDELAGLRATQRDLRVWAPPEPDLGFRVIRNSPAAVPPVQRARINPLWGLAAAAVLVLAAGAAVAHIEVRYGADGLVLRTGWSQSAGAPNVVAGTAAGAVTQVDWKQQAEALERRVRQLEASASTARPVAVSAAADPASAEVLRRVSAMIDQSETRQQRAAAQRITQLTRDIDARRKVDLALIDQGLMRLQSTNGAELRQSRDLMQRMYRATAYQPK
jgi:anti-sigma factor ChrR (cupin superfamily)